MKRFEITTCCGDHLSYVQIRPKKGETENEQEYRALRKAGYRQHICDGCYDHAYNIYRVNENGRRIY